MVNTHEHDRTEPGSADELAVELTAEELVVLANALRLQLPLPEPRSLQGATGVRAALVDLARRSLVARRVLWTDGLEFRVVDPIRKLLELMAEPGLVVRLGRTNDVARFAHRWSYDATTADPVLVARPGVGVEILPLASGNVRLTPFAPQRLLERVRRATGIVDRPRAPDVRAFDVAADAAAATLRLVATGQAQLAVGSLLAERVDEPSAKAFVAALANGAVAHAVEVSHRPAPTVVAGGVCNWIDGGGAGLWTLPTDEQVEGFDSVFAGPWSAPPPSRRVVTVEPVTVESLMDELAGYLPGISV